MGSPTTPRHGSGRHIVRSESQKKLGKSEMSMFGMPSRRAYGICLRNTEIDKDGIAALKDLIEEAATFGLSAVERTPQDVGKAEDETAVSDDPYSSSSAFEEVKHHEGGGALPGAKPSGIASPAYSSSGSKTASSTGGGGGGAGAGAGSAARSGKQKSLVLPSWGGLGIGYGSYLSAVATGLVWLDLSGANLGDKLAAKVLDTLANNKTVMALDLSNNGINDVSPFHWFNPVSSMYHT